MTKETTTIRSIENRIQLALVISIFFPYFFSLFSSEGNIITWSILVGVYILDYVLFQGLKRLRASNKLLGVINIVLLVGIALFVFPIIFLATTDSSVPIDSIPWWNLRLLYGSFWGLPIVAALSFFLICVAMGVGKFSKLDLHILALKYAEKHPDGFTLGELCEYSGIPTNQCKQMQTEFTHGGMFAQLPGVRNDKWGTDQHTYILSFGGKSQLLAHKTIRLTIAIACLTVVMLLGLGIQVVLMRDSLQATQDALGVSTKSFYVAQRALEISAMPALNIIHDTDHASNNKDIIKEALGFIETDDSVLRLILLNNSVSKVEDVDIRMTLWKIYVDESSRHLTVCPLGYVDHTNNPSFIISHLGVGNVINTTISLSENEKYPFTLYIGNLNSLQLNPETSNVVLKINVRFVKEVDKTNHHIVKLYRLGKEGDFVVDIDSAPQRALSFVLNDKKNELNIGGVDYPSIVYPFQEEEFLEYFKEPSENLELLPSACREFRLLKELKTITY